jgi:hypothetical protein
MTRRILLLNIAELIDMGRLPLTEFIPVVRWPLFQWVSKPSQEALVFPTEDVDGCFIPGECYSHDQVVTDALVNKKCKILAMIFAEADLFDARGKEAARATASLTLNPVKTPATSS